jgi:hypothetical protein
MTTAAPTYPLVDAYLDGGIDEWGWVAVVHAATAEEAVEYFRNRWPEALEVLNDEPHLELVATGETSWHRQSPCLTCEGSGAGSRPRLEGWLSPVVVGPREPCATCDGSGEQRDDGDGIAWEPCRPEDEGAVEFWDLQVRDREGLE